MTRVEVPGSSFMLCLGPGHSSLLHLTRANAEKPYAGGTAGKTQQLSAETRIVILGKSTVVLLKLTIHRDLS
jgi:hypothetical protein